MADVFASLLGQPVWSGCGEEIGRVIGWTADRSRGRFALTVMSPEGHLRVVEREHVATAGPEGIHLKGPRQGYHIAPLGFDISTPVSQERAGP